MNVFLACFLGATFAQLTLAMAVKTYFTMKMDRIAKRMRAAAGDGEPPVELRNAHLALDQAALRYGAALTPDQVDASATRLIDLAAAALKFYELLPEEQRERCPSMRPCGDSGRHHGGPPS